MGGGKEAGIGARLPLQRIGALGVLRRLIGARRGAMLVEFALLMLPFFMLLFAILEVGLVIWGGLELDNATMDAARLVRTGQAQSAAPPFDAARLKQEICAKVFLLGDCQARLRLDVRSFARFAGISAPAPLDAAGQLKDSFVFEMGEAQDIVLMTSFYEWPLVNIVSSIGLGNMANGNVLLSAATTFRNEPYPEAAP